MQYYELICKAFIKKDVAFQKSFELLSKYISFSMYQEGESKVHQKEGFKYYVFGGLLPIENEKVYKQGNSTFAHKTKLFFGVSTDNSDKVLQFF